MARKGGSTDDVTPAKSRWGQIRQTYKFARKVDPRIGLWTFGSGLLVLVLVVLGATFLGPWWAWLFLGLPLALLATTIMFGRRAESAAYTTMESQVGGAASAMAMLRKGWNITPAVGVNRSQDLVHRAVGRPGIVLVGEGTSYGRVRQLIGQESKRHRRIAPDTPITELVVGDGSNEDEVALRKLNRRLRRLERKLTNAEVSELNSRLRAMPTQQIPMPKGPLPKNARMPRGGLPR